MTAVGIGQAGEGAGLPERTADNPEQRFTGHRGRVSRSRKVGPAPPPPEVVRSYEYAHALRLAFRDAPSTAARNKLVTQALHEGAAYGPYGCMPFAEIVNGLAATRNQYSDTYVALRSMLERWIEAAAVHDPDLGIQHAIVAVLGLHALADRDLVRKLFAMGDPGRMVDIPVALESQAAINKFHLHGLARLSLFGALMVTQRLYLVSMDEGAFSPKPVGAVSEVAVFSFGGQQVSVGPIEFMLKQDIPDPWHALDVLGRDSPGLASLLSASAQGIIASRPGFPLAYERADMMIKLVAAGAQPPDADWAAWARYPALTGVAQTSLVNLGYLYLTDCPRRSVLDPVDFAVRLGGLDADCGVLGSAPTPLHVVAARGDIKRSTDLILAGADCERRSPGEWISIARSGGTELLSAQVASLGVSDLNDPPMMNAEQHALHSAESWAEQVAQAIRAARLKREFEAKVDRVRALRRAHV
jgi:hypothetical protein